MQHLRWLACAAALIGVSPAQSAPEPGAWRAVLRSPGGELPFGLRLTKEGGSWRGTIQNGTEACAIASIDVADGRIAMSFAPYDSSIDASIDGDGTRLTGRWRARRDGDSWSELEFEATHGAASRFTPRVGATVEPHDLPRRFSVDFSGDDQPAVLVIGRVEQVRSAEVRTEPCIVQATFLTTLGDYRYLAGSWDGELLRLSCFDGAHAFLFRAARLPDGTLAGDFWSKDTWHETFVARADPGAALPDAFGLTRPRPDVELGSLRFAGLDGVSQALDAPEYAGRARILYVFGTWCPNCRDATRLLVELDTRYRERGLAIVGLAFERTGDAAIDVPQVRRYVESQGVRFPMLIGGIADKAAASAALPLVDRIRAFPTTLFVDRSGVVSAVHTGFSGPATDGEHDALRKRFTALVEDLLR